MCFFAVTGGTITVIVFYHGNGLHGNYSSFTSVKTPRGNPRGKLWEISCLIPQNTAGLFLFAIAGRPGSSELPRNPLTRWDVSSIPANGIFVTKKKKTKKKNAQRVEND